MYIPPNEIFQELFTDLHKSGLWPDGKTISDAIPLNTPDTILNAYRREKANSNFDLKAFFNRFFKPNPSKSTNFKSDTSRPVQEHIEILWDILKRKEDQAQEGSSLIPLPYPYIVPGGRFNEIYYWDSYFTMLGLQISGKVEIIEHMIDNFSFLIDTFGFIPNGNRTYFLGRSQPPFYSLMVNLLAEEKGEGTLTKYLPFLEKEYAFWMNGTASLEKVGDASHHVVKVDGGILNRYFDRFHEPRAEMYQTDVDEAKHVQQPENQFYANLRAACESGWDFSSRWFKDPTDISTIHTVDILPVDLNCLLLFLEDTIAKAHQINGHKSAYQQFTQLAKTRFRLIHEYFWDDQTGYFHDFDFVANQHTEALTMAGMFPLFFNLAKPDQAKTCAEIIEAHFLKDGGLVTTPLHSGQQWDAPNGWAPLQWIGIKGLRNYGFDKLAHKTSENWCKLNTDVYKRTGKLMEKYNVEDTTLLSGGGEYEVQDGFGWTNGVLLKLLKDEF